MNDDRFDPNVREALVATCTARNAFIEASSLIESPAYAALCMERAHDHDRAADSLMSYAKKDPRAALLEAVLESRRAYRLTMSMAQRLLAVPQQSSP